MRGKILILFFLGIFLFQFVKADNQTDFFMGDNQTISSFFPQDNQSFIPQAQNNSNSTTIVTTTIVSGGGGGFPAPTANIFEIKPTQLLTSVVQGSIKTKEITVKNTDTKKLDFVINIEGLNDLVLLNQTVFSLAPGESKNIPIVFIAREDTKPDLYVGKIKIISGNTEQDMLVGLTVDSRGALLDVKTEIPRAYKLIEPGNEIVLQVTMFNLGVSGRTDINVEYIVKNSTGAEILTQHETVALETQVSFLKTIKTPDEIPYGDYIVYVKTLYADRVASATDTFQVVSSVVKTREKIYIVVIIALVVIFSLVAYAIMAKRQKKNKKEIRQISLRDLTKK